METTLIYIISFAAALGVTALLGFVLIPVLHRLKFGQNIITGMGPVWHRKKQGTPTMGGWMFIIAVCFAAGCMFVLSKVLGGDVLPKDSMLRDSETVRVLSALMMAFCFSLVGFADDFLKIRGGTNLGLTELQKTIPQVLISACYLTTMIISDNAVMYIPFAGKVVFDSVFGKIFYIIFGFVVIYATVNAANFTDGIDGLCAGSTLPIGLSLGFTAFTAGNKAVGCLAVALSGAMAGFLFWNRNPAKVMMGDTGSNFIGGLVAGIAFACGCPLVLLLTAIVYVIEAVSDIIQIFSVRLLGRKILLMTPVHHHFEMKGWSEKKIDGVFFVISALGSIAGAVIAYYTITAR